MNSEIVRNEIVIDWKNVFHSIVKRWWILLLCVLLGASVGLGLGIVADVPVYECEAVYVMSYSGGGETISSFMSEYSFLTRIMYNVVELVKQNTFMNLLADDLNVGISKDSPQYLSPEILSKCIAYSYDTRGTMLYVTVTSSNAELSHRIVLAVNNHFQEYVKETYQLPVGNQMELSQANTIETPTEPVPSKTRFLFTLIGAAACGLICLAILAISALADTRIKKEDDLKNRYNVPVLGTVPNFFAPELNKGEYYRYGSNKK